LARRVAAIGATTIGIGRREAGGLRNGPHVDRTKESFGSFKTFATDRPIRVLNLVKLPA
jgi:hypothetical protein